MASAKESYLDIYIRAKDEATKIIKDVKEQSKSTLDSIAEHSTAIGGAMTAVGGSIVLLTDGAKKTNAALGVTGLQIGATEKEMRDLALATTNITFPLDQVVETFDLLARSGMRNTDQMQTTANAFSDLGTAIGADADVLAEQLIPAFNAFNIPLEDVDENIDTLTHLFRNTTIDMGDFATTVNRLSPDLDSLGITMEDAAAILEALADKGVQGTAATRLFRTAISSVNAAGDELEGTGDKLEYFYDQLGITTDKVDHFKGEIEGATGITDDFAEAQEKQFGTLDIMKQKWDEWSFAIGSALEPLDTVGAVMAGIGPILMGVQPAMKLFSALQVGTLVPSLGATAAAGWAAIAPWLPLVVAIGAVIAIGWLLYNNWDDIVSALGEVWDKLVGIFSWVWDTICDVITGAIEFVKGFLFGGEGDIPTRLTEIWEGITDFFGGIWNKITDIFGDSWKAILLILFPPIGVAKLIYDNWDAIKNFFGKTWENITNTFGNAWSSITKTLNWDTISSKIGSVWEGIQSFFSSIWDKITGIFGDNWKKILGIIFPPYGIAQMVSDNWGMIENAVDWIWNSVKNVFSSFFLDAMSAGRDIVLGLWDGIWSLQSMLFDNVRSFAGGIFDSVKSGLGKLWPFSPSEAGVDVGEGLMMGIEKGIENSRNLIRHAISEIEGDMDLTTKTPSDDYIGHTMGLNQVIGGLHSTMGGYGRTTVVEQHTTIEGNTFHIREEADIIKIARELERMRATKIRSRGIKEMAVW